MRRIHRLQTAAAIFSAGMLLLLGDVPAIADTASAPSLVISQLKITSSNGQFLTLYNAGSVTLDMSKYQLEYFNHYDLSKATSSKLISLSGTVPPHSYFMVNDSALLLCYQLTVDSVSLGFSSTAGMVEVLGFNQSGPGASASPVLQDYVGWSKTAATGAQTLPSNTNAFLQRTPVDASNNPKITSPGTGSWQSVQPDTSNACQLVGGNAGATNPVQNGLSQLLPATEPPATIVGDDSDSSAATSASLPAADVGLMAPQLTELLPNPAGTGNDATNEFIELYNPNVVPFDLSGFGLQAGTTVLHKYIFPDGASLPAQSFIAFYAPTTGLSLSNSGGQVKLLDPFGNSISASEVYDTAADGQSWALAKGTWHWTTKPTPGAANIVVVPAAKTKASSKASTSKSSSASKAKGSVKGAKTKKKASTAKLASSTNTADATSNTPIHSWILALIASGALLYGAYEYRTDLANRVHQFRRNLRARRANRP